MPAANDRPGTPARRPGLVMTGLGHAETSIPGPGQDRVPPFGAPGAAARRLRWLFSSIWLIYLIQPVADLFKGHHSPLWIAGGLVIITAFCAVYMPLVGNSFDNAPRPALLGVGAICILAAVASIVYGTSWTPLWLYVSAATGVVLAGTTSRAIAVRGVFAVTAAYTFFSWLSHTEATTYLAMLLVVLLMGIAMVGFRLQVQLTRELSAARDTVAKLAANEERLRLARDMHDLTGQSLSMITLKSEVAAKRLARLPHSPERDAIAAELADISQVSRQTLHDIREAVSGYRRPTLAIEVITARTALDAAGLAHDDDPELVTRSGTFDPDAEAVLAWCLREAVTNVIRHSGAARCEIRLSEHDGELSLMVTDDGEGFAGGEGTGLRGMSERLAAAGGRLELTPVRPHGFRVTAAVPAPVAERVDVR